MLKTLHGRLALTLLALFIPLSILFIFTTLRTSSQYYQEITQQLNKGLAQSLLAETPDLMIGSEVNPEKFTPLAETLAMTNPGVEVYILNREGSIIGSSVGLDQLERLEVAIEPLEAFLGPESRLPVLGTDPRRESGQKIFSVAPLPEDAGYIYVLLADQLRDSVIRTVQGSTALRLGMWGIGAMLLSLFGIGALAFTMLTKRLRRLEAAMTGFKENDFSLQDTVYTTALAKVARPSDEIDELQNVFVDMTERISEQVQGLREVDKLRRELISNVSHDLRTPLAALRGYLETLEMKKDSLTDVQKEEYLKAASKQSERLGRLIADLFDLSRLDANAVKVDLEAFPLQDLAQDIVLDFKGLAEKSGVDLELVTKGELKFVRADIGLIERALSNLVDNALRYTPMGGKVRLELTGLANKVSIKVSDTGRGISEENLPQLFERFYRVENNMSDGSGLGLAITKRIVALHGEDIQVKSQVGKGASFSFALPKA